MVQRNRGCIAVIRLKQRRRPAGGVIGEGGFSLQHLNGAEMREARGGRDARDTTTNDKEVMCHGVVGGMDFADGQGGVMHCSQGVVLDASGRAVLTEMKTGEMVRNGLVPIAACLIGRINPVGRKCQQRPKITEHAGGVSDLAFYDRAGRLKRGPDGGE